MLEENPVDQVFLGAGNGKNDTTSGDLFKVIMLGLLISTESDVCFAGVSDRSYLKASLGKM